MTARTRWLLRIALLLVVAGLIAGFFASGLDREVSLAGLRANAQALRAVQASDPLLVAGAYVGIYVLLVALSVPSALVLTLTGGALFGLVEGTVLAVLASSLGATLAMLASRFVLRGVIQRNFAARLSQINAGLARDGWMYLFSLRLVPVVPFVLVNLIFGMTTFPTMTFMVVSFVGMLPATAVYVNAGTQLEHLDSVSGILSPWLIGSFVLLALLPFAAKAVNRRLVKTA